jgi:hypothetical protein
MVADEHQVPAATAQTGKIAMKDDLTKWMNRFQSVGIDKDLLHIRSIGFQGIDQLMGGGAVEIPVEGEVDTISVFMLENLEIHSHRLSSFPPPGGGIIRLPEKDSSIGRQVRHTGSGEAAGGSTQASLIQIRNHRQHNFHRHTDHIQDAASHETKKQ